MMADTKFTPGPWQQHSDYDPLQIVADIEHDGEQYTYLVVSDEVGGGERAQANAALIAAAPDLYAALMAIHNMLWGRPDIVNKLRPLMGFAEDAISNQCAAALAKARGEL